MVADIVTYTHKALIIENRLFILNVYLNFSVNFPKLLSETKRSSTQLLFPNPYLRILLTFVKI